MAASIIGPTFDKRTRWMKYSLFFYRSILSRGLGSFQSRNSYSQFNHSVSIRPNMQQHITYSMIAILILFSSVFITISTAPLNDRLVKRSAITTGSNHMSLEALNNKAPSAHNDQTTPLRHKRQLNYNTNSDEVNELERELGSLSDRELETLGMIVQNEIDKYQQQPMIDVANQQQPLILIDDGDDDDEQPYALVVPDDDDDDHDQLVLIPQSIPIDGDDEVERRVLDELQLRLRIAQLADILNRRAMRGF